MVRGVFNKVRKGFAKVGRAASKLGKSKIARAIGNKAVEKIAGFGNRGVFNKVRKGFAKVGRAASKLGKSKIARAIGKKAVEKIAGFGFKSGQYCHEWERVCPKKRTKSGKHWKRTCKTIARNKPKGFKADYTKGC